MRPVAQSLMGSAELASGRVAAGLEWLELAANGAASMGLLFQQPLRLALLAEALSAAGRPTEAAKRRAEAEQLAASQGDTASLRTAARLASRATG
jgi:hypothetical protein